MKQPIKSRMLPSLFLILGIIGPLNDVAYATNWGARREFREGIGEIARERREMRREVLQADSRQEARQAVRDGMRDISRERREMRRGIRREVYRDGRHHHHNERNGAGALIAGVIIGAVITAAVRGTPPSPPSPELCWQWSNGERTRGFWRPCEDGYWD